jgi:CBS domain-containing protein
MDTELALADLWPDEDPLAGGPGQPGDRPVATLVRPCVIVATDEPLTAAWQRIRRSGDQIGVVVDANAHCVGLLGLREASRAWPAAPPLDDEPTAGRAVGCSRVARINARASLRAAARTLLSEQIGAAPVVGPDGRVLGLVTALDLLAGLADHSPT